MPRSTHLFIWVGCRHYFLLSFVDAFSRYVVHHRLLTELRAVIKAHGLLDIRTRARHPESNGIVKRFTGTVRQDSDNYYRGNYLAAERLVTQLIDEYNNHRLHAALGYFESRDLHFGNPERR